MVVVVVVVVGARMLLQRKRIGQCSLSELRCGSGSGSIAAVPAVVAVKLRKTSDGGKEKSVTKVSTPEESL